MSDLHKIYTEESANIDLNIAEKTVLRGFQKLTGDIIKIRSLYDYCLVKAKSVAPGHHLSLDGSYNTDSGKDFSVGDDYISPGIYADGTSDSDYIALYTGQEIVGRFSEVKVIDGSALITGYDLETPTFHLNFINDFANQPANMSLGGFGHQVFYWLDASIASSMTVSSGKVSQWRNLVDSSAGESFNQLTVASRPALANIDLSAQGGDSNALGVTFDGLDDYLIGPTAGSGSSLETNMRPTLDYFTVAMLVSGGASIDGGIFDRAINVSGNIRCEYRLEIFQDMLGNANFNRRIGDQVDLPVIGTSLASLPTIMINSIGYDTELADHVDYFWMDSNPPSQAVATANYGGHYDNGSVTYLGALLGPSGITQHFAGTIHEMIIFKNRLSVGNFNDYGLNEEMVNAIARYFDAKWFHSTGYWEKSY